MNQHVRISNPSNLSFFFSLFFFVFFFVSSPHSFLCLYIYSQPPMSTISLKNVVLNSKFLSGLMKPAAKAYAGAAGYQQIGKILII